MLRRYILCPDPEEEAAEAAVALAEEEVAEAASAAVAADFTVALAVGPDPRADRTTIGIFIPRIFGAAGFSDPITTVEECSAVCSSFSFCP